MKTNWDYTRLADAYLKRPDYSPAAIAAMIAISGVRPGDKVCDVGAGVGHLTALLAERGFSVTAVEPNDAMRSNGIARCQGLGDLRWMEGTGEETRQDTHAFDLVTFGSSFNVCDRMLALRETARIARPRGWFACMWNHRDLGDIYQAHIESIIASMVPGYGYGTRREDQTAVLEASGLFASVVRVSGRIIHEQGVEDCIEAWRSHATLARQAGDRFAQVVNSVEEYVRDLKQPSIKVPYETNIWVARLA